MGQFFLSGGYMMWPILATGILSVLFALAFAFTCKRQHAAAAIGSTILSGLFALLGFTVSMQLAFSTESALLGREHGLQALLVSAVEAMMGIDLALLIALTATVLVTIGIYRGLRAADSISASGATNSRE